MGEMHDAADLDEKTQPLFYGEPLLITESIKGLPLHEFHDEVGAPLGALSAVEKARNSGMFQVRENLTLPQKPGIPILAVGTPPEELDGDPLFEFAVGALGLIDDAHPSPADAPEQSIVPDQTARCVPLLRGFEEEIPEQFPDGLVENAGFLSVVLQQATEACGSSGIFSLQLAKPRFELVLIKAEVFIKERQGFLPDSLGRGSGLHGLSLRGRPGEMRGLSASPS